MSTLSTCAYHSLQVNCSLCLVYRWCLVMHLQTKTPPSIVEVRVALRKLNCTKASWICNIRGEMLKGGGEAMIHEWMWCCLPYDSPVLFFLTGRRVRFSLSVKGKGLTGLQQFLWYYTGHIAGQCACSLSLDGNSFSSTLKASKT